MQVEIGRPDQFCIPASIVDTLLSYRFEVFHIDAHTDVLTESAIEKLPAGHCSWPHNQVIIRYIYIYEKLNSN